MSVNDYHPFKPPIAWLGGKSRLRHDIIKMIPPDHTTYVEVFGGAMWVMFGKGKSKVEVYNDVNSDLVNFWRVVKSKNLCEDFLNAIDRLFASREVYGEFVRADRQRMTEVERAVCFWYLLKLGFGGMVQKDLMLRPSQPPPALDRADAEGIIKQAHTRLRKVWIEHLDFAELIKRWDKAYTFFFCDPPYYDTKGYSGEGVNPFGPKEHRLLHDILTRKVKGRWLFTINDHEWIRENYKDCHIKPVKVFYSMCKDKKDTEVPELIITNYEAIDKQTTMFDVMGSPKEREYRENAVQAAADEARLQKLEAEFGLDGETDPELDESDVSTVESGRSDQSVDSGGGSEEDLDALPPEPAPDAHLDREYEDQFDIEDAWEEVMGDD